MIGFVDSSRWRWFTIFKFTPLCNHTDCIVTLYALRDRTRESHCDVLSASAGDLGGRPPGGHAVAAAVPGRGLLRGQRRRRRRHRQQLHRVPHRPPVPLPGRRRATFSYDAPKYYGYFDIPLGKSNHPLTQPPHSLSLGYILEDSPHNLSRRHMRILPRPPSQSAPSPYMLWRPSGKK